MKIIDILIDSASLLGMCDEMEILNSVTADNEVEILNGNDKITSLFNLVKFSIRELCSNYFPMVSCESIRVENGTCPISSLKNYIRIQNVYKNGNVVKFKIINRNILLEEDGEYIVDYESYPTIKSMLEEIDFLQEFSPDVTVLGLCAYYSLAHGMFSEFQEFHEKYVAKAESLKSIKNIHLPSRRWEWE